MRPPSGGTEGHDADGVDRGRSGRPRDDRRRYGANGNAGRAGLDSGFESKPRKAPRDVPGSTGRSPRRSAVGSHPRGIRAGVLGDPGDLVADRGRACRAPDWMDGPLAGRGHIAPGDPAADSVDPPHAGPGAAIAHHMALGGAGPSRRRRRVHRRSRGRVRRLASGELSPTSWATRTRSVSKTRSPGSTKPVRTGSRTR